MSKYPSFSHAEYKFILTKISDTLPILDYSDIDEKTESFCVIRHDVEFSLERAYSLAKIEHGLGISTSYFIQINNNTYNPLSLKNRGIINKIRSFGHKIGVHFSPRSSNNDEIIGEFYEYKRIMELGLNYEVDRFSYHRPNLNPSILRKSAVIKGVINVYDPLFFQYFDGEIPDNLAVKYVSDSNHQWRYGNPLDALEKGYKKIQILFHPFSWSKSGGTNHENFRALISEKNRILLTSFNSEISNFPMDIQKK